MKKSTYLNRSRHLSFKPSMVHLTTVRRLAASSLLFASFLLSGVSLASVDSSKHVHLPNFSKYKDVKQKKTAFFEFLLPFIQQSNAAILKQRRFIQSLDFNQLSESDQEAVQALMERYRLKQTDMTPITQINLLRKLDIIPPSLALAQAANETAWGSSRFAKQGLNFYGQWCFEKGCGLVPLSRPKGEYHEVKTFKTPLESVKSYMLMLNSHPAFKPLRDARRQARLNNQPINGLMLVNGLKPYSARKEVYVASLATIIRVNQLVQYDAPLAKL